jgi:hypothetical protein
MDIVIADIKISTKIKAKTVIFELKDFVTTNPISQYGKDRILRKTNGNPYEILNFTVKKVVGETCY